MKKSLLFISALIAGATGFAQSIPGGGFGVNTTGLPSGWTRAAQALSDSYFSKSVKGAFDIGAGSTRDSIGVAVHSNVGIGGPAQGVLVSGTGGSISAAGIKGGIPYTSRPATLAGFAKYAHATSSNHGGIAVLVTAWNTVANKRDTLGGYTGMIFSVDASANYTNFNIPITYNPAYTSTPDSIQIILMSSLLTETAVLGDTLFVDNLRFLSCTINPAATLATPSVISDNGASGLSAEGTGTLTATPSAAYNHTFTFSVPDPSIGTYETAYGTANFTLTPIDSVIFGTVTVLPGLTFTQGYPSGVAYPNSLYCYSISGTIPATDDVLHQMNIVQTPYGTVTVFVPAFSQGGTTTAPQGTILTQPVDLTNTKVDSIIIKVGNPVGIADFDVSVGFNVSQNSPNPFDGSTTITFNCAVSGNATFVVTDVLGRQVYDTKINATAGSNTFTYSTDLANGTYFFSLSDGTNTITRTMVVSQ